MKRDIAIIGMSGKYPKSKNIEDFWNNLINEKEFVHFFSDEELKEKGIERQVLESDNRIKASAFIENPDEFDYTFFKYTLDEAKIMSPQTRMMHQLVWKALEDAGYNIDKYHKKTGIYLGANRDLNWSLYTALTSTENVDELMKNKVSNPNFMTSLIAYKFNIKGPCYFIDTACSTSLSTIHLACRSLLLNECGMAIAGGIRLSSSPHVGYEHNPGSITSSDGHTRSFDKDSSGTIFSDGAGVVILKKLEEAIKDNDHIYAVVKGSAMNNDGSSKAGYTMPSVEGQSECVKLAQKIAGVSPNDINYIEAHGTGTRIGDPIEIESLNKAFGTKADHKCAIGTVKSNMGHADEAAGVTGFIKTALALKYKTIPGSLHFKKSNPAIDFKGGPFQVNATTSNWEKENDKPLTAGVSSFGIGGTNVHVILQEKPDLPKPITKNEYKLIQYSANTIESLENYESKLLNYLHENKHVDISDLAYTLQVGRKRFEYVKSHVAKSKEDLIEHLKAGKSKVLEVQKKDRIVFMFSGQGSQYLNMGKDLYDTHNFFRREMDNGFSILKKITGNDYKDLIYPKSTPNVDINDTRYTQPVLFLFEYALAQFLIHLGVHPDYMIGHSLGEYVAACISGVFSLEDALLVMTKRGELMANLPEGDMISVGIQYKDLNKSVKDGFCIAAINSPSSMVFSGTKEEMTGLKKRLDKDEIPNSMVKTSHAFHSHMMNEMLDEYNIVLEQVSRNHPNIPFISNLTGELVVGQDIIQPSYWIDHVRNTVNFEKGINTLMNLDNTLFVEIGPGKTLTTFFNQCIKHKKTNAVVNTIRHPKEQINDEYCFQEFLGKLQSYGKEINWEKFYGDQQPSRISMPSYSFDKYHIPAIINIKDILEKQEHLEFSVEKNAITYYTPSWSQKTRFQLNKEGLRAQKKYLIFSNQSLFEQRLKKELLDQGNQVIEIVKGNNFDTDSVKITINPNNYFEYQKLEDHLRSSEFIYDHIVYCWGMDNLEQVEKDGIGNEEQKEILQLIHLLKSFRMSELEEEKKLTYLCKESLFVVGSEVNSITKNYIKTLLQVVSQEAFYLNVGFIDIDQNYEGCIHNIYSDISTIEKFSSIAYRNRRRWIPKYESISVTDDIPQNIKKEDKAVYLVTGNLDEMNLQAIENLLELPKLIVIFIGKSVTKGDQEILGRLQGKTNNFCYVDCDITRYEDFSDKVRDIEKQYGEINGIFHSGRNLETNQPKMVHEVTETVLQNYFSVRVKGLQNIELVFKNKKLDFVIVFSSISSIIGGVFYGGYATACSRMEDIALTQFEKGHNWTVISLDRMGEEKQWINKDELKDIFNQSIRNQRTGHIIVSKRDINSLQEKSTTKDKKQKTALVNRKKLQTNFKAPQNETETKIVELFENLFGIDGIGVEDDFFDLGGDSLKGIPMVNKVNKEFSIHISLTDFFNNSTVSLLSSLIDNRKWLSIKPKTKNELFI